MTEDDTICSLHKKEATAIVCIHLVCVECEHVGFNVPGDTENDLQAWCDQCEVKLNEEGGWTDAMEEFADLRPCCAGCFVAIKNRMSRE